MGDTHVSFFLGHPAAPYPEFSPSWVWRWSLKEGGTAGTLLPKGYHRITD